MKTLNYKIWKNVNIEMINQKWKEVMHAKLNSFIKLELFEPIIQTLEK